MPLASLIMMCAHCITKSSVYIDNSYWVHKGYSLAALIATVTCMHVSICMQSSMVMHSMCTSLLQSPPRHQQFSASIILGNSTTRINLVQTWKRLLFFWKVRCAWVTTTSVVYGNSILCCIAKHIYITPDRVVISHHNINHNFKFVFIQINW